MRDPSGSPGAVQKKFDSANPALLAMAVAGDVPATAITEACVPVGSQECFLHVEMGSPSLSGFGIGTRALADGAPILDRPRSVTVVTKHQDSAGAWVSGTFSWP